MASFVTVQEVAQRLNLALQHANGKAEYHGPNPNGDGATQDGFILYAEGNAWDRATGTKYTSAEVARMAKVEPAQYEPCRQWQERNGHSANGYQAKPTDSTPRRKTPAAPPQPRKPLDTRTLEERGITRATRAVFSITESSDERAGKVYKYPTYHPNGTRARDRRKFQQPDKAGTPDKPKKNDWLKSGGEGTPAGYGLERIKQGDEVLLVNGEVSVWLSHQEGFTAIGPLGEGRSAKSYRDILQTIKDAGAASVRVLLDNDATGRAATASAVEAAHAVGLPVTAHDWPQNLKDGYDAADLWEACQQDGRDFHEAVEALPELAPAKQVPSAINLPTVEITDRQLRDASAEALAALVADNDPPRLFMRGAVPVRVGRDEHDRPIIEKIGEGELRHELTRAADFQRTHANGKTAIAPPLEIVRDILATPELPFPPLVGITQTPTLRPDGSIFDTPGYDPATRLLFAPQHGTAIPTVPVKPTLAEVEAARELVLEAFADFPFVDNASRAGAIALTFTSIVRPSITGPVPLAVVDAPQAGTGKGKLVDVVAIISTGHPAAVEHAPANDEEWDKRITANLRDSPTLVALDDVSEIKSPSLARALTASEWKGRILGRSENVTLPQRATWAATGNNIRLGGDIPRRCYWIRLDAQTSRPWERNGFRHPDLLKWTSEHRNDLVAALLTMARAWFVSGCPSSAAPPIGSFEDWTRVIGGILQHAHIVGFLDNLSALYDAADDEGPEWEAFLAAWRQEFGSEAVTTAQLHDHAKSERGEALREALPAALLDQLDNAGSFRRRMGKALLKRVGRRFGAENLHISRASEDTHGKVARWQAKSAGFAGFAGFVSAQREASFESNKSSHRERLKQTPQTPQTPQSEDDTIFDDEPNTNYGSD